MWVSRWVGGWNWGIGELNGVCIPKQSVEQANPKNQIRITKEARNAKLERLSRSRADPSQRRSAAQDDRGNSKKQIRNSRLTGRSLFGACLPTFGGQTAGGGRRRNHEDARIQLVSRNSSFAIPTHPRTDTQSISLPNPEFFVILLPQSAG